MKTLFFLRRTTFVAVVASNLVRVSAVLSTPLLCDVTVRSYILRGKDTIVGVIQDVDSDVPDPNIAAFIFSTSTVIEVCRFENSQGMKTVFLGDCLPVTVNVGMVRHPVRPYVTGPLQCLNCTKL